MIIHFRHRGLRRFHEQNDRRFLPAAYVPRIKLILDLLDVAPDPAHLNVPALRLHRLRGDLNGFWAVTVSANLRIIFRFEDGNATDVDLIDYH